MKLQSNVRRRRAAGFSLLEMVIVLGIIGIIIGGAITMMGNVGRGAEITRVRGDFQSIGAALRMYRTNAGHYPSEAQGLSALVDKPTTTPQPKDWTQLMEDVPKDPWGQPYGYKYPGTQDKTTFEIVSKGPDTQEGTDDDLSSQEEKE